VLKIIVTSPDEVFGGALAAALSGAPDVGDCSMLAMEEAAAVAEEGNTDVLVLHAGPVEPPDVARLAAAAPVLVLGTGSAEEMIASVEAGAMGYVDADSPFETIAETVRSLAKGVATVEPKLLGALLRHVVERRRAEREARKALDVLTPRENQVFSLLAQGLDSGDLAEQLFISSQTVRTHTQRIMTKLDLHSRSELVALAARCGLDLEPIPGEEAQ